MKFKFLILSLSSLSLCGCSVMDFLSNSVLSDENPVIRAITKQTPKKYKVNADDVLPILGYAFIPGAHCERGDNPSYINRSNFELYKEAGFTVAASLYDRFDFHTSEVYNSLRICDDLGLKYLFAEPAFLDRTITTPLEVSQYEEILRSRNVTEFDSFCGVALMDEPGYTHFNVLGNAEKAINNVYDNAIGFATLYPNDASASYHFQIPDIDKESEKGDNMVNYERYVDYFLDIVDPQIIAYDHYLYHTTTGINVLKKEDTTSLFKNMSLIRKKAREKNKAYWASVSSYRHIVGEQHTHKETEWQTNMTLAYGAQGLQYYTYWPTIETMELEDINKLKYFSLTTGNGTPNDNYYRIKELNKFFHSIEHIIMKGQQLGMIQYGFKTSDIPACDLYQNEDNLIEVKGNGSIAVGRFNYNNKPAYYVVNDSVTDSIQTYVAKFSSKQNVRVYTYNSEKVYNDVSAVGFNLYGGQGVMLEVID